MKRILLTGMSGTGKSTLTAALAARGYTAVDADSDAFSAWRAVQTLPPVAGSPVEPERDWVWREEGNVLVALTAKLPQPPEYAWMRRRRRRSRRYGLRMS